MNTEIKALWIEALEDPNAKQLTGYLGTPGGSRCCLGVLCDIAVKHGIIPVPVEQEVPDKAVLRYGSHAERTIHALPNAVVEWAGLGEENPCIVSDQFDEYDSLIDSLAALNDNHNTFIQIAEVIREQL